MSKKCRIWWPDDLSTAEIPDSVFLFGWIPSSSSDSVDVVVAFAFSEATVLSLQSDLQGILNEINCDMPGLLQDKCPLSLLGHCAVDLGGKHQFPRVCSEKATCLSCKHCTCDGLPDISKLVSVERSNWIQLSYKSHESIDKKIKSVPTLHHMHCSGLISSQIDLHVILYETPMFGSHHFSLEFSTTKQVKTLKAPMWLEALHQKQLFLDLDTVILAINSAHAAKACFGRHVGPRRVNWLFFLFMLITLTWRLLAVFVASLSTLFYVIFQFLNFILSYGPELWMDLALKKLFSNTWKNIQFRRRQILYWPAILGDNSLRSQSCVEYAEKSAIDRHSLWSSIATDILFGYIFGGTLYSQAEFVSIWVSKLSDDITDNLLRSGCVWLMGVPAGFKLNTELAEVLGMICLNAIQIWSTLWFFLGPPSIYFIKGLAISAIMFGLTTPAALIMDTVSLATIHVTALHCLISRLYSLQIQAITALWRLFRGRKWNPLRHRFDSYDYSVEQHIVGSLLFTPILLLLPTTSVFYIFFTIVKSTISFMCLAIEAIISLIHATPFLKILVWLMRPKRFPSGIWFDIKFYGSNSEMTCQNMTKKESRSSILVSFLRSNTLNLREIVSPDYKQSFSVVSSSFIASTVYGILIGKSVPSTLGIGFPSTMPWMFIPCTDYWHLCCNSILGRPNNSPCSTFKKTKII